MRRLSIIAAIVALASLSAEAQMMGPGVSPGGTNFIMPDARKNINTGLVSVTDYGAVGDALRVQCAVTTTATNVAVLIAPGSALCAFTAADVGKPIVIWNAGASATLPLATTIATVVNATNITVALAPGQSLAASTQYVSWGTDNATAIAAAYTQAAKQTNTAGQQGFVYFPPSTTNIAGAEVNKYYGTTAAVGVAPNSFRIATLGAGPYKSMVLALAAISSSTSGLLFESAGYSDGNVIRDIGFDGNMLAANVAYLACSPNSRLDNVTLSTSAAAGTILKVGASGSGACPAMVASAIRTNSLLNVDAAQYPDKHVDINSTDTQWFGLLTTGPATTNLIHIESTASNTSMVLPHTSGASTGAVIQIDATISYLGYPQIDNGGGTTITGINVNGVSAKIIGGRHNLPAAASVGISVAASKAGTYISGFDCNRFTTAANCIQQTYPVGNNNQIFGNGSSTVVPAIGTFISNQAPSGTTSLTGVMMGLAGAVTPRTSGYMRFEAQGDGRNSLSTNGFLVDIRYGTGTAPANGDACSGSSAGSQVQGTAAANVQRQPFALSGYNSSATVGTAYWYDLCLLAVTAGTATVGHVDMRAFELDRY